MFGNFGRKFEAFEALRQNQKLCRVFEKLGRPCVCVTTRPMLSQSATVQERVLQHCTFQEILRRDIFHPGVKYLYGKYYLGYAGIQP